MKQYQHYVNGAWTDPDSGEWFDTENPYTGEVWAKIARGNAADMDRAVAAAKQAFEGGWGTSLPSYRGKLLCRLADIIDREADRLGRLEVQDNGKLLAEMGGQTKYIGEWYRYFGGLADKIEGTVIPTDKPNMFNFTRYEPFGVVGLITPWNSPLLLVAYKLAPALAAGNTAVIKPSEFTSASTLEFMELIAEAGFPDGVVNVVTGFGAEAGGPLVDHPDVAKIAFTGSDLSGQKIYEQGAKKLIPVTLELGGKSPNILFDDADKTVMALKAIEGLTGDAGGVGANGQYYSNYAAGSGANGGSGKAISITGSSVNYAPGGPGAGHDVAVGNYVNGSATSYGAGGAGGQYGGLAAAFDGADGVCIIAAPQAASAVTGTYSLNTSGRSGYHVYTFTGNGSITF